MTNNMQDLSDAIDYVDADAENVANHKRNVRRNIESIYKLHNQSKLNDLDDLMLKYRGREDELLRAVEKKYRNAEIDQKKNTPWQHVLKNYEANDRTRNQDISFSLEPFRSILDDLASAIGGECAEVIIHKQRKFVVRQVDTGCDLGYRDEVHFDEIISTVETMRQILHKRYEHIRKGKSIAHLHSNEYERRKEEKRSDRLKKRRRDKKRHC